MKVSPCVSFAKCGTEEEWARYKQHYPDVHKVMPGTLYVNEFGICLVTSQEWVNWLLGKTDTIPGGF